MEYCLYASPVGNLIVTAEQSVVTGLRFEGEKSAPIIPKGACKEQPLLHSIRIVFAWLDDYFAGKRPEISNLPLAPKGSPFQMVVWNELIRIPYGQTITYGQLAVKVARQLGVAKMSAQAIGGAVGRNPISIIVPCHRVIGAKGSMTGYAGGVDKKVWLLQHEGIIPLK